MQKSESILSHAYLHEILHYSVITGQFYWIKPMGQRGKVNTLAGSLHPRGYLYIKINRKRHLAHRLAWFWATGEWPANEIDHENGVKDANYWLNLREATRSQNCCNIRMKSNNTSGYKGVYWHKASKKWRAYISANKKRTYLGLFENIEEAYAIRIKVEKELHGDFARI